MLVSAAADQIARTASDSAILVAGRACDRLFAIGDDDGLPPGPRLLRNGPAAPAGGG